MAKNGYPFGMTKTDAKRLTTVLENRKSLVLNFHRSNPGSFTCSLCGTRKKEINVARTAHGHWLCHACAPQTGPVVLPQHPGCSPQPNRTDDHRWGIRFHNGTVQCIGCDNYVSVRSVNHINDESIVDALRDIEKDIKKRKADGARRRKANQKQKAAPYIHAGLAEPFALAIARGVNDGEVMDLWESDWWKQYPADDELIVSVLKGEHAEDVARTINGFRGEHPELAHACIVKDVKVDWATMLLNAGFDEHPEAVVNVLCGGEPQLVARIRQMKVDKEALPPSVGMIINPIQLEAERKAKHEDE